MDIDVPIIDIDTYTNYQIPSKSHGSMFKPAPTGKMRQSGGQYSAQTGEFRLSYHNPETMFFSVCVYTYPYYVDLNKVTIIQTPHFLLDISILW